MIRKLGWFAAGGFVVGIVLVSFAFFALIAGIVAIALSLAGLAVLICAGFFGLRSLAQTSDAKFDPTVTERHWAWDGGDTVDIAVPATLHYHRGSGDQVIARLAAGD
jgi:hypothetical protein